MIGFHGNYNSNIKALYLLTDILQQFEISNRELLKKASQFKQSLKPDQKKVILTQYIYLRDVKTV